MSRTSIAEPGRASRTGAHRATRRVAAVGCAAALALAPASLITAITVEAVTAPVAVAAPTNASAATAASTWLATQFTKGQYYTSPYTNAADVSGTADLLLGTLAGNPSASVAPGVDAWLKTQAAKVTSTGQLAKLAIVASAMGDDPASYGGVDLVAKLQAAVTAKSGDLGDPYSEALTIIALHRAGAAVPDSLVAALAARQAASGEFFFGTKGQSSYFLDPDSSGVAISALSSVTGSTAASAALSKANAWATGAQKAAGYWYSFSPANTTGLVGSALLSQGVSQAKATAWLVAQQKLAGGQGLPASLNGTDPDAYATAQALFLLGGETLATVTRRAASTSSPTPSASSTPTLSSTPTASATPMPSISVTTRAVPTAPGTQATTGPNPLPETGDAGTAGSGASESSLLLVAAGGLAVAGVLTLRGQRR